MSDDYISHREPRDTNGQRESFVHFDDDALQQAQAHMSNRRMNSGGSRGNSSDASVYASGVNKYPSQLSAYSSENGRRISRQNSADIADENIYDMYESQQRPDWKRGLSLDSVQQESSLKSYDEKRGESRGGRGDPGNRRISLSRAASLDSVYSYYARRPPTLGRAENAEHHGNSFLGRVNDAFHRVIKDPIDEYHESRRRPQNQRDNSRCIADDDMDNFERAQCINDEIEDTYLIDEEEHNGLRFRRHPQERMGPPESVRSHSDYDPNTRKTYHQRRQKGQHTIKYHAESIVLHFSSCLMHHTNTLRLSCGRISEIHSRIREGFIDIWFTFPSG